MKTKASNMYYEAAIRHLLREQEKQEFKALFNVKCPHCGAMYAIEDMTHKSFDVCPECWTAPTGKRKKNVKHK